MVHKIVGSEENGINFYLNGICLFNDRYIFCASAQERIYEFDLISNKKTSSLNSNNYITDNHNNHKRYYMLSIKTIDINNKKIMISHSDRGLIELWEYEDKL